MIITENEFSYSKLKNIIGEPIKLKNINSLGSCGFYLKLIKSENEQFNQIQIDSKCNIQTFTDGILLRFNHLNNVLSFPINYKSLKKIELIRGEEFISPQIISLMKLLLKLGVKIRYARYFANNRSFSRLEYRISDVELKIETSNLKMKFITNGYYFENQVPFFKSLNKAEKTIIRKKPTHNTG